MAASKTRSKPKAEIKVPSPTVGQKEDDTNEEEQRTNPVLANRNQPQPLAASPDSGSTPLQTPPPSQEKQQVQSFGPTLPTAQKRTKAFVTTSTAAGMVRIKLEGGGKVPEVLNGKYTHKVFAQEAIDRYMQAE